MVNKKQIEYSLEGGPLLFSDDFCQKHNILQNDIFALFLYFEPFPIGSTDETIKKYLKQKAEQLFLILFPLSPVQ